MATTGDGPLARSNNLIVEELGDEILVYDTDADRGHSLSPEAARVWRSCDGGTSAEELSARLGLEPDTVERALGELSDCELLEVRPTISADGSTRREVTLRLAKAGAAAAAAPLILSVAASPALAVTSPGQCTGQTCANCTPSTTCCRCMRCIDDEDCVFVGCFPNTSSGRAQCENLSGTTFCVSSSGCCDGECDECENRCDD